MQAVSIWIQTLIFDYFLIDIKKSNFKKNEKVKIFMLLFKKFLIYYFCKKHSWEKRCFQKQAQNFDLFQFKKFWKNQTLKNCIHLDAGCRTRLLIRSAAPGLYFFIIIFSILQSQTSFTFLKIIWSFKEPANFVIPVQNLLNNIKNEIKPLFIKNEFLRV